MTCPEPKPFNFTFLSTEDADAVLACIDLADRAGARDFELRWDCPHNPCPDGYGCSEVRWTAFAIYRSGRFQSSGHARAGHAAAMLAEGLLTGRRWEPSCTAAPIHVPAGGRGDSAAIGRAYATQVGNRAVRRWARRHR